MASLAKFSKFAWNRRGCDQLPSSNFLCVSKVTSPFGWMLTTFRTSPCLVAYALPTNIAPLFSFMIGFPSVSKGKVAGFQVSPKPAVPGEWAVYERAWSTASDWFTSS